MGARSWIVGVVLAALAAVISNLGLNLQKLTHIRQGLRRQRLKMMMNNDDDDESSSSSTTTTTATDDYHKQPLWLLGLSLIILGSIADFVALGFGAQSTIAPLGSLTLVANVYFAPLLLNEELTRRDMMATIAIIVGSVLSVAFASHDDTLYSIEELFGFYLTYRFAMYSFVIVSSLMALWSLLQFCEDLLRQEKMNEYKQFEKYHRFCYSAMSGLVGAQSVLFAKCCAELLVSTVSGEAFMFAYIPTYFILVGLAGSIFYQLKWLNEGLARFDALYVVPVFQAFWIVGSVGGGLVFFGEYRQMSSASTFLFPLGICISISGVYVLSKRSVSGRRAPNKHYERLFDTNDDDLNELEDMTNIPNMSTTVTVDIKKNNGNQANHGDAGLPPTRQQQQQQQLTSPIKKKKKSIPSPRHLDRRVGYGGAAAPATFTPSMMGRISHMYTSDHDNDDDDGGGDDDVGGDDRNVKRHGSRASMDKLVL